MIFWAKQKWKDWNFVMGNLSWPKYNICCHLLMYATHYLISYYVNRFYISHSHEIGKDTGRWQFLVKKQIGCHIKCNSQCNGRNKVWNCTWYVQFQIVSLSTSIIHYDIFTELYFIAFKCYLLQWVEALIDYFQNMSLDLRSIATICEEIM